MKAQFNDGSFDAPAPKLPHGTRVRVVHTKAKQFGQLGTVIREDDSAGQWTSVQIDGQLTPVSFRNEHVFPTIAP